MVHDELDLPFGALRLKLGGGDNGHNGLKSITPVARAPASTCRVRFGIGRPPGRQDPADFVLRDFSAAERKELTFDRRPRRRRGRGAGRRGPRAAQNPYNT